jgi:hypothetical protein
VFEHYSAFVASRLARRGPASPFPRRHSFSSVPVRRGQGAAFGGPRRASSCASPFPAAAPSIAPGLPRIPVPHAERWLSRRSSTPGGAGEYARKGPGGGRFKLSPCRVPPGGCSGPGGERSKSRLRLVRQGTLDPTSAGSALADSRSRPVSHSIFRFSGIGNGSPVSNGIPDARKPEDSTAAHWRTPRPDRSSPFAPRLSPLSFAASCRRGWYATGCDARIPAREPMPPFVRLARIRFWL